MASAARRIRGRGGRRRDRDGRRLRRAPDEWTSASLWIHRPAAVRPGPPPACSRRSPRSRQAKSRCSPSCAARRRCGPPFADRLGAASGVDVGFVASSSILVGGTPSDARDLVRSARLMREAGATVEPLGSDEIEILEPALAGQGARGLLASRRRPSGQPSRGRGARLGAQGARCPHHRGRVRRRGDRRQPSASSFAHHGALGAEVCVLATGAAHAVAGTEGSGCPGVRPVRGATLRLGPVLGVAVPTRTVRAVVDSTHCYLVPRSDGSLVVGATSEEQGYRRVAPSGGIFRLLEAARAVYPGLDELIFEEASVGLRPATEDHLPFVARLEDRRFVAAFGHYRNGILLAPLAGSQVAELLAAAVMRRSASTALRRRSSQVPRSPTSCRR